MTDEQWQELREFWQSKLNDKQLKNNMIPWGVRQGRATAWVSRQYVENMQRLAEKI